MKQVEHTTLGKLMYQINDNEGKEIKELKKENKELKEEKHKLRELNEIIKHDNLILKLENEKYKKNRS